MSPLQQETYTTRDVKLVSIIFNHKTNLQIFHAYNIIVSKVHGYILQLETYIINVYVDCGYYMINLIVTLALQSGPRP